MDGASVAISWGALGAGCGNAPGTSVAVSWTTVWPGLRRACGASDVDGGVIAAAAPGPAWSASVAERWTALGAGAARTGEPGLLVETGAGRQLAAVEGDLRRIRRGVGGELRGDKSGGEADAEDASDHRQQGTAPPHLDQQCALHPFHPI